MIKFVTLLFLLFVFTSPLYAARLTFHDLTFPHAQVCPPSRSPFYASVSQVVSHPYRTELVSIVGHVKTTSVLYMIEKVSPFSVVVRMYNPGYFCQAGGVTLRFWFVE